VPPFAAGTFMRTRLSSMLPTPQVTLQSDHSSVYLQLMGA
jgi:hypothetical protein